MEFDPTTHPVYNRLYGATVAYAAIANMIAEILTLSLDEVFEPESPEYIASADTLNGLLFLTQLYEAQALEEMQRILKSQS